MFFSIHLSMDRIFLHQFARVVQRYQPTESFLQRCRFVASRKIRKSMPPVSGVIPYVNIQLGL